MTYYNIPGVPTTLRELQQEQEIENLKRENLILRYKLSDDSHQRILPDGYEEMITLPKPLPVLNLKLNAVVGLDRKDEEFIVYAWGLDKKKRKVSVSQYISNKVIYEAIHVHPLLDYMITKFRSQLLGHMKEMRGEPSG